MTRRIVRIFAYASIVVLGAQAQSTINGPVAGYVFDKASQALRPILGLPGASLLGDPVSFGFNVTAAYVAPRLDAALAVASDGSFHYFRIQSSAVQEVSIDGLAAGSPYRVAFSPAGKAMAVYAANSVQFLAGLPDSPAVAGSVDLTDAGTPDSLALSDDAKVLLVSVNHGIRLFGSYADMGKLMDTAGNPALAFAVGGHDAAVSDAGAGVVLFHNLLGSGETQTIAAPDPSGAPASAVAFTADGKTLYVASSSTQTITRLDLTAGASDRLSCACAPTTLARMGNVFRLTELATDPLWLLDRPESDARVVFVPALVAAATAQ